MNQQTVSVRLLLLSTLIAFASQGCRDDHKITLDLTPTTNTTAPPRDYVSTTLPSNVTPNYINQWLVLGTFDNTSNAGMGVDYIGEATITPADGTVTATQTWKYFDDRVFIRNFDDYQDLYSYYKLKLSQSVAAKVVYAHAYIYSPTAVTNAQVLVGATSQVKVWMNGTALSLNGSDYHCGYTGFSVATVSPHCKDDRSYLVNLQAGWNKLLLKVGNLQEGQLGFYARVADLTRAPIAGLTYGVSSSSATPMKISNRALTGVSSQNMPTAFRGWPYYTTSFDRTTAFDSWFSYNAGGTGAITAPLPDGSRPLDVQMQASPYMLIAEGGTPPYTWTVTSGSTLPTGLSLEPNGVLHGTIDENITVANYSISFTVTDGWGNTAVKSLDLKVEERPNRWYEQGRLGSLIHLPELTAMSEVPDLVTMMKKQGYKVGTIISYNNGDNRYHWRTPYSAAVQDRVTPYATEIRAQGMKFGMYLGMFQSAIDPLGATYNHGGDMDGALAVIVDAMNEFNPDLIWFDWASNDGSAAEALFSAVRAINPNTVIVLNGIQSKFHGDWDVICSEGWLAWRNDFWDLQPYSTETWKWPKKGAMETWRNLPNSGGTDVDDDSYTYNWAAYLRQMISFIGEGHIVNLDHSVNDPGSTEGSPVTDVTNTILGRAHQKMVDWANPVAQTPLYTSYTNVDIAPIDPFEAGYALISADRLTMYVHFVPGTPKRTGTLPASITLTGVNASVASTRWFNTNTTIPFTQTGSSLTLDLTSVSADPISTIIKINLSTAMSGTRNPVVNLALGKAGAFYGSTENVLGASGGVMLASYGTDGDINTTAQAGGEYAYSYDVDLGAATTFTQMSVAFDLSLFATAYDLKYSTDHITWTTLKSVSGNTTGGYRHYVFPAVTARYVRVKAITPNGGAQLGGQMGIAEVGVYK